jgi:hypothetical protein
MRPINATKLKGTHAEQLPNKCRNVSWRVPMYCARRLKSPNLHSPTNSGKFMIGAVLTSSGAKLHQSNSIVQHA